MRAINEANLAACALALCTLSLALGMVALAVLGRAIPTEISVPAATGLGGLLMLARQQPTSALLSNAAPASAPTAAQ